MDEYLDLVNENDEVIGKKLRSEIYAEHLSNFRTVDGFVINTRGELLLLRRASHKKTFPLCLDMSVGGHVVSGETYDQAFVREAREELNLDLSTVGYTFRGCLTPRDHGISCFTAVYEIHMDQTPDYNQHDFIEHFWLTPRAFFERLEQGERVKSNLPILIRTLYMGNQAFSASGGEVVG